MLPKPRSTNPSPATIVRAGQFEPCGSSSVNDPAMIITKTGPGCVCHPVDCPGAKMACWTNIRLPSGLAARATASTGMSSIRLLETRKPRAAEPGGSWGGKRCVAYARPPARTLPTRPTTSASVSLRMASSFFRPARPPWRCRGPCVAGALWAGERVQMRVPTADRIGLLGTPALITEDGLVPLRLQPKALALLGYVATAGRPVSRRDLARLLFPDADDARGALRWQLTRLRSALPRTAGRHLRIEREEVALALATDVAVFRAAAERVLASFDPQAARAAIELYRGDFLSGLAATTSTEFDTWLYLQEESLRTLFRRVTLAFARWAIDGGHPDEALEPLARLVALDPYAEEGHVMRVEALLALGAEERARAAYGAYAQLMRDDLHAEPR